MNERFLNLSMLFPSENWSRRWSPDFPWYDEYPPKVTETVQRRMWYWRTVVYIYSESKKILCVGTRWHRSLLNHGRIQSIFDEKAQSTTTTDLSWLLIEIVTWWCDFEQIGTCGVRSDPSLRHYKEIMVIIRNKFCNGRIFVMYWPNICVGDLWTPEWSWVWVDVTSKQE